MWSTYGGGVYFLSICTCCVHGIVGNRCKLNFYYDDHQYEGAHEGYACSPQYWYHDLGVFII